jgi:hypothetical protein
LKTNYILELSISNQNFVWIILKVPFRVFFFKGFFWVFLDLKGVNMLHFKGRKWYPMDWLSCCYFEINIQTNNQVKRSLSGLNQRMTHTTRVEFYDYPTIPKNKNKRNYHNMTFKKSEGKHFRFLSILQILICICKIRIY